MSAIDLAISEKSSVLEKVRMLEEESKKQDQVDVPSHYIQGGGVGVKTILLKARTTATGGMHRFESMTIIHSGDILVITDGAPIRYTVVDSPVIFVAPAGSKRAVYAIKDTYWSSLMPTTAQTVEDVEEEFIVPPAEQETFLKMIGNT